MKQSLANLDFLKNLDNVEEFKKYAKLYMLTQKKALDSINDIAFVL
jgi:hypothetical protein